MTGWIEKRRTNPASYPRTNFVLDFVQDLAVIAGVNLSVKLFYFTVGWSTVRLPSFGVPDDMLSYLPIELTRVLVTIADAVSILAFLIIGIATLVKLGLVQVKSVREEAS